MHCLSLDYFVFWQSVLPSSGGPTARGNVTVILTASVTTWQGCVPVTTIAGDLSARRLVSAKRASVTKIRGNVRVTPGPGARSATTTATAASTRRAMWTRADACATLAGWDGTARPSATATTRRASSTRDAASVGRSCGVRGVKDTASASTASATRMMGRVRARLDIVGSSAGNRVPLDFMGKTAGTGKVKKKKKKKIKQKIYVV